MIGGVAEAHTANQRVLIGNLKLCLDDVGIVAEIPLRARAQAPSFGRKHRRFHKETQVKSSEVTKTTVSEEEERHRSAKELVVSLHEPKPGLLVRPVDSEGVVDTLANSLAALNQTWGVGGLVGVVRVHPHAWDFRIFLQPCNQSSAYAVSLIACGDGKHERPGVRPAWGAHAVFKNGSEVCIGD